MKNLQGYQRTSTLLLCLALLLASTLSASAHNAPSPMSSSNQETEAMSPGATAETYAISGQVTSRMGTPLPGVQISAGPSFNAITGPDGAYTLPGLTMGTYTVTASLPGYRLMPSAATVQVPPDRSTLDFTSALDMSTMGQIGGTTTAVALQGDLAFINRGPRLTILDVHDPAQPILIGQTAALSTTVMALMLAGHYAYVLAGQLYVFDVSDPVQPTLVGQASVASRGWDMTMMGNYIYFGGAPGGVTIVNVADPAHPVVLERCCNLVARHIGVTTEGTRLYTAGGDGLSVFDLAFPERPTAIGKIPIVGWPEDVVVSGRYAYVAAGRSGLHVIDVADPAQPVEVGALVLPESDGNLAMAGHTVYYGARENGLRVIDVGDPTRPTELGRVDTPGSANGAVVVGDFVYLGDYAAGLRVINVADPMLPHEVGAFDPGPGFVTALALNSNYLYTGNWISPDIRALDVSAPSAPRVVGRLNLPGSVEAIQVQGSHAFVAAGDAGLRVVSIADPAHMQEVGAYDTPGYAQGLALVGHYIYVADGDGGLRVLDASDPAHPQEVSTLTNLGWVPEVATDGSRAYLLANAGSGSLHVLDVTDPAHPEPAGTLPLPIELVGLTAENDHAYVAAGRDGLRIVDATNPAAPVVIGSLDTPGRAWDVTLSGAYAFVADLNGGIRAISVANPAQPVEAGSQPAITSALDVAVGCFVAYVANGVGGIEVLRTDVCPDGPDNDRRPTPLALSTPITDAVPALGYRDYSVPVADGQSLLVELTPVSAPSADAASALTATLAADALALYGRTGALPTWAQHDLLSVTPLASGSYELLVPAGPAGVLNLSVYGRNVPGTAAAFRLAARPLDRYVSDCIPRRVGNAGSVTLHVTGLGFTAGVRVQLTIGSRVYAEARSVTVVSPTELWARFEFTNMPLGNQDLTVLYPGGSAASRSKALWVMGYFAPRLVANIWVPKSIRQGRVYTFSITYTNLGNTDIPAPRFRVSSQGNLLALNASGPFQEGSLGLPTALPGVAAGFLPPEGFGRATFYMKTPFRSGLVCLELTAQRDSGSWDRMDRDCGQIVTSDDPNEKRAPAGVGSNHVVDIGAELNYSVFFENVPSASAPAQEVFVTDWLDPQLDWSTFRITEMAFGDQTIGGETAANGQMHARLTIPDPRTGVTKTWWVDLSAQIDYRTGRVDWVFRTLDPATGDLPEDALAGFLPPNDAQGRGEGHVSFVIRPVAGLPSGTLVTNAASIIFDTNSPIETNTVSNMLGAPPGTLYLPMIHRTEN